MAMTIDAFVAKYLGQKVDYDGHYGGQCVDLYRQYVKEVLALPQSPPVPQGACWIWQTAPDENYLKISNTPTAVPERGDIVIWNSNVGKGYGHVAIFLDGDVNKFVSLDQNWPTLSVVTKTEHRYANVIGWLRPKTWRADRVKAKIAELREKLEAERDLKRRQDAVRLKILERNRRVREQRK